MCGIYGYIGKKPCRELILDGLKKLEYRGYDSAGIATLNTKTLSVIKKKGKLLQLVPELSKLPSLDTVGIGHTRWATHGLPEKINAHPHYSKSFAIVHNGIIENYQTLKKELQLNRIKFTSETDTEVILHLLEDEYGRTKVLAKCLANLSKKLQGAFALGILCLDEPETIYLMRRQSPLVVGRGTQEYFFSSDVSALSGHATQVLFMQDDEIIEIARHQLRILDDSLKEKKANFVTLKTTENFFDKQGFSHFMLKEIYEQPVVIANSIKKFCKKEQETDFFEGQQIDWSHIHRICIVACGTAFYAGKIGQYFLETNLSVPVSVELASEFRYRSPSLSKETLVVAVSQSGETADTLACVEYAKMKGCQTLALCNSLYSSIARASTATFFMDAGVEVGVASTKAFSAMVFSFYLLGRRCGPLMQSRQDALCRWEHQTLKLMPVYMNTLLEQELLYQSLATKYADAQSFLYMGRGYSSALALEGALKLKEISYIHAEGYAGGELKHGPIALIDHKMPVFVIAPQCEQYEKMLSNIEEICARGAQVIALGAPGDERLLRLSKDYIPCPQVSEPILQTLLSTIPLQLFAYYMARQLGADVDQPRNLAKSVTVE